MQLEEGRCRETVSDNERWPSFHQCSRKIWKDGYCKTHHHDSVEERRKKSEAIYEETRKRQPWYLLHEAQKRIAELENEIRILKGDSSCS